MRRWLLLFRRLVDACLHAACISSSVSFSERRCRRSEFLDFFSFMATGIISWAASLFTASLRPSAFYVARLMQTACLPADGRRSKMTSLIKAHISPIIVISAYFREPAEKRARDIPAFLSLTPFSCHDVDEATADATAARALGFTFSRSARRMARDDGII